VRCESIAELLPDHTLGTLEEAEAAAVRRHLRGCAACRDDATRLDQGVAMFGGAVHESEPPRELEERVLSVLAEEWRETSDRPAGRRRRMLRWAAAGAVAASLAGAIAWGAAVQIHSNHLQADATSYRALLDVLGGNEVRVATLQAAPGSIVDGTAVLYDSDHDQSWALVLVRAPGYSGTVNATLFAAGGRRIDLRPMDISADGDGSTWLVTSSDIARFLTVRLTDESGRVLATGTASRT
jgi:hypothetical protein